MKDKEWLKGRIKGFQEGENMFTAEFNAGVQDALEYVQELIDQLDEPEVLSQKWVDENVVEGDFRGGQQFWYGRFIEEEKVRNLLVPKQELPVIPQFVADWIESQDDPIYEMCVNYEMWGVNGDDGTTRFTGEIAEWFDDTLNVENYYRACIDDYEVEKEKRYFIKEPVTGQFLIRDDSQSRGVKWVDGFSTSPSYFTEAEIKAIDERYWAFEEEVKD